MKDLFGEINVPVPQFVLYDTGGTQFMAVDRTFLCAIGFVPKDAAWKTENVVYFGSWNEDSARLWKLICSLGYEERWNHAERRYIDIPYQRNLSPCGYLKKFVAKERGAVI
jgi:hypothetical protein